MRAGEQAPARSVGRVLLNVAAVGGAVCLAVLAVSLLTGASLVVFRTGSMAPTMQQGAVAVVRPIAASAVHVGDVVTVARRDQLLPITHRVVSIAPTGAGRDSRQLTLKGDANTVVDPVPYRVDEVGLVLASAPHLGSWLVWWGGLVGRLLTGLSTTAALAWAFWPRSETPLVLASEST